jgi:hypothetical protein
MREGGSQSVVLVGLPSDELQLQLQWEVVSRELGDSQLPTLNFLLPFYHDAFRTPGINPCSAISRNAIRLSPNARRLPRLRPVI